MIAKRMVIILCLLLCQITGSSALALRSAGLGLSVCLSVCVSLSLSLSVCLSVCLPAGLSLSLIIIINGVVIGVHCTAIISLYFFRVAKICGFLELFASRYY